MFTRNDVSFTAHVRLLEVGSRLGSSNDTKPGGPTPSRIRPGRPTLYL